MFHFNSSEKEKKENKKDKTEINKTEQWKKSIRQKKVTLWKVQ